MTTERNKELVSRWYEVLGREDWADYIAPFFATPEALEGFRAEHAAFRKAFPDYHFAIDHLIAEGDVVAVFGTAHGTHLAEYPIAELRGIPPTGRELAWHEAMWVRLKDGVFVDGNLIVDGVGRLQQMGILPEHGLAELVHPA